MMNDVPINYSQVNMRCDHYIYPDLSGYGN